MKKILLASLFVFKLVSMEQLPVVSDVYKKEHGFDMKTFELHWSAFGFGEAKMGWPDFYIDEQ